MTQGKNNNKSLFSQHYLQHQIQDCPEWLVDVTAGFKQLKSLYQSQQNLLSTFNQVQTQNFLIQPALEILGFSYIYQVNYYDKSQIKCPNYALFNHKIEQNQAYCLQTHETAFYSRVIAIAQSQYWQRPLSKVLTNDQRDIDQNTNPSFQIINDLIRTGVNWGILTNGREWRLYYRLASSKATEFYPIDLLELLETENLEQFKYFWLFFRQEAFVKNSQGRNFLEGIREESTRYSRRVENELKALVFERIFPNLAGGFVANATRQGQPVTSKQVYKATLSFVYKLLFLLYAEARNLLPMGGNYRDYSLMQLTQEVAQDIKIQKRLSPTSTEIYDRLLNLFQLVGQGEKKLGISPYNGSLFDFNFSKLQDQLDDSANYFLSQFKLPDVILAPLLDQLAQFEGKPIDYHFLDVRQLGSIYEELLEYQIIIEDATTGKVYLENDQSDRRLTGSYYTPDYIIKYMVSQTLKPILEQRSQQFSELMEQIYQLYDQIKNQALEKQSLNNLRKELQQLQQDATTTLLDIKVCDPAMGSGHFLLETVDYLTDELIYILTQYPEHNPVLEMLDQTRQSIVDNLEQQDILIDSDQLDPTQLLQRLVIKRCIYGVDLNPMAVELAKVSLWLHSFTIGAHLSFLDHHLRCGNSLIGTTIREVGAKILADETGQSILLTGSFVELLKAGEIMQNISILNDVTFVEVEQSKKLFRYFNKTIKPYKQLLNRDISHFFELKPTKKTSYEKQFFHWDLEFPEVFIDLKNATWKENAGFDAVIGNPPYDILAEKERKENLGCLINYLKSNPVFAHSLGGKLDLYRLFICRSDYLISRFGFVGLIIPLSVLADQQAISLRKFLLHKNKIRQVNAFPQKDDPNRRIFRKAKLPTCIIIFSNSLNNQPIKITVHPGNLLEEISGEFYCSLTEIEALDDNNLPIPLLSSTEEVQVLRRFNIQNQIQKVKNICSTYQGEINETTMNNLISKNPNSGCRILRGGNIQRYEFIPQPKQGMTKYLNVTAYYQQMGGNRIIHTLQPRIGYQRNAALDSWKRLIFTPLPTPCYCFDSVSYFLIENNHSAFTLLALLNSNLLEWRFRLTSTNNHISISEIAALPIPIFTFNTPLEHRQKSLENAIAFYHQYQSNGNLNPLLTQVNYHLNQQPPETDIIHDLLAYLAEQMIELNKQKQTEIQSFLQGLEGFMGCSIDTLNHKSKIRNYLGDYYKTELHLGFDEFISVLNKNKLKIAPLCQKKQQMLEQEYQNSLNILLPLKTQLMRCDKLIDAIVYRLYGLTEAEIAIVERSKFRRV
ncbi:Genome sequencing data, contig C321 [Planktothrix serta PCC 8927]|uniref:site-specific DNA-methyltransferase (adenine-specific) n=1 Tax=Planktothrix serta PCC 8927 TaxID=671068 RepID=A0A7Z9BXG4_9CYAN|nr:Eco57I restriction-modification methylase domain-containing protein [Planktothrix serta]VXD24530.1 Genome sequencing data, contig C321 [Planktothrix serta PCC 8927]